MAPLIDQLNRQAAALETCGPFELAAHVKGLAKTAAAMMRDHEARLAAMESAVNNSLRYGTPVL